MGHGNRRKSHKKCIELVECASPWFLYVCARWPPHILDKAKGPFPCPVTTHFSHPHVPPTCFLPPPETEAYCVGRCVSRNEKSMKNVGRQGYGKRASFSRRCQGSVRCCLGRVLPEDKQQQRPEPSRRVSFIRLDFHLRNTQRNYRGVLK